MPGVEVELKTADEKMTLAKTITDGAGQVSFPDVPLGRYFISATRPGFVSQDSAQFDVRSGETAQVLLDIHLAFTVPPVEVRGSSPVEPPEPVPPLEPTPEPLESLTLQPVSASDMLSGSLLDVAPLEGDDFQSLLPLLPGVVRGADGRLRVKGGHPTQGALQISSASLIDPSSGDFDLDLPGPSVESVEVMANPFAAEYGRFSTSITQVRTRRGTNEWEIKPGNLMPRFRKGLTGIRGFEPRFSVRGPLKQDRLFLAQDFQYRYVATPVKSLPDEPEVKLTSFDSFTRVDSVLSTRHTVGGGVILFPREIRRVTMDTFRPPEVTPDFNQSGASAGLVDRFGLTPGIVLESTFSGRWFEINVNTDGQRADDLCAGDPERRLLQRSGARGSQRPARRGDQHLARSLGRAPCVQVRLRPPELGVQRDERKSAHRDPAARRIPGRAHGVRRADHAGDQRDGARRLRTGPLADWSPAHPRAGPADGSGCDRRARQLVAARRHVDRRAARWPRHPARRRRKVFAADAAQYRRLSVIRNARRVALRGRWLGARAAGEPSRT